MKNTVQLLLIVLTVVLPFLVKASSLQTEGIRCDKSTAESEICQFELKIGNAQRRYKYEIRRAQPGFPTLVAIPGGPGQGLIGSMKTVKSGDFIPDNYGIILIEPRGVGQNNFGPDQSKEIYSTENVSADILKIIKIEKLKNYFVHGQSYGTVVATVLGNQLSSTSIPKPKGIILSGVLDERFNDILSGYNFQLARLYSYFSPLQKEKILKNLRKLSDEFGENQRIFAVLFINTLTPNIEDPSSNGRNTLNMKRFFELLSEDNFDSSDQAMSFFQETAKSVGKIKNNMGPYLRNYSMEETIKCRELTNNDGMLDLYFDFDRFQIVSNFSDCKQKGYVLDNPFFSKNYQINDIPIYYIQGLLDPATPVQGARMHFNNQKSSQKIFVQLDNYAHTGLIGLWPCKAELWESLESGISEFSKFITRCNKDEIKIID